MTLSGKMDVRAEWKSPTMTIVPRNACPYRVLSHTSRLSGFSIQHRIGSRAKKMRIPMVERAGKTRESVRNLERLLARRFEITWRINMHKWKRNAPGKVRATANPQPFEEESMATM
jgi:hypothetical protein